jgi:hypothetical protein
VLRGGLLPPARLELFEYGQVRVRGTCLMVRDYGSAAALSHRLSQWGLPSVIAASAFTAAN